MPTRAELLNDTRFQRVTAAIIAGAIGRTAVELYGDLEELRTLRVSLGGRAQGLLIIDTCMLPFRGPSTPQHSACEPISALWVTCICPALIGRCLRQQGRCATHVFAQEGQCASRGPSQAAAEVLG
jgi:hypothetical protein